MQRLSSEHGAVAVIMAVLLVTVFGMAAFVIDAAALYQERRELQRGADAAALALAESCARASVSCTSATDPALDTMAETYADANADDGAADALVDPADFDPLGRVTVQTTTRDAAGTILPFRFAQIFGLIDADGDHDGSTVAASATAVWGSPSSLASIPLTVSSCEFEEHTNGGTTFAESPYDDDTEVTLTFHDGNSSGTCPASTSGQDADGDGVLPAGFGWLVEDGECNVETTVVDGEDWVTKAEGTDPECEATRLESLVGQVVPVPVFEDFCRGNSAGCPTFNNKDKYRIGRYAAFYLSGYDLGGPSYERYDGQYRTVAPDCGTSSQDDRCITGFFTTDVVSGGGSGGPAGGVITINLVR